MATLTFDFRQFQEKARQLGVFKDDQLPFAISRTLNDTMFKDARPQIIGPTWKAAFKVRNAGLPRASIRVLTSTKGNLTAGLYDALGKANLGVHAKGGARPKPSAQLAIPNQQRVRLTAKGRNPRARQIPSLVSNPGRAVRVIKGKGVFVGQGGRLHAWYWFRSGATLRKRFRFYEDFRRVTLAGVPRRYPAYLQAAVASSFR
jgi:hypothetical protein